MNKKESKRFKHEVISKIQEIISIIASNIRYQHSSSATSLIGNTSSVV